jgi:hypothetical protein
MADKKIPSESPDAKTKGISRREFARRAALAAASSAALPAALFSRPGIPQATEPSAVPQQPTEGSKLSPASQAEVEAKIQAIFRKYGGRLTEEQKADVKRLVTEGQKPLESLRAFPLLNADEPATVLKLYPEPGPVGPQARARKPSARPRKD